MNQDLFEWERRYDPASATADNMRALLATAPLTDVEDYLRAVKDRLTSQEDTRLAAMVLAVYAPLANRLNLQTLKHELEDNAFRITHPEQYEMAVKLLRRNKADRDKEITQLTHKLSRLFQEVGIDDAMVTGRTKKPYSLYKKLHKKGTISDVHDLLALRIIVPRESECYRVLDVLHTAFTPRLDRFKDYIKQPKPNGYRSLHSSISWGKKTVEVQIRTPEMDRAAEEGAAAHWHYDQHKESKRYLRGMPAETITGRRTDAVYVFSPAGDVYALTTGATPLDFAFAVHTGVGLRTRGAKVNGAMVKLDTSLSQGDLVEIVTGKEARPHEDWLHIVVSPKARNRIRTWLRGDRHEQYLRDGRQKLIEAFGGSLPEDMDYACRHYGFAKQDDLYMAVGAGYVRPGSVHNLLTQTDQKSRLPDGVSSRRVNGGEHRPVVVSGMEGLQYRMAACCGPRPGDTITGYITRSLGVSIHKSGCSRIEGEPERLVDARWQ